MTADSRRLNLGCGNEIRAGWMNVDAVSLPGIDVVQDLRRRPWPWPDGRFDEIVLQHVLEHLPDTIGVVEEIWRIAAPGARVIVRVPYWNSSDFITDPTHVKAFNEHSFDFFDPDHPRCRERPYYARARFSIRRKSYFVRVLGRYFEIRAAFARRALELAAAFFCNVIQVMEFELETRK